MDNITNFGLRNGTSRLHVPGRFLDVLPSQIVYCAIKGVAVCKMSLL